MYLSFLFSLPYPSLDLFNQSTAFLNFLFTFIHFCDAILLEQYDGDEKQYSMVYICYSFSVRHQKRYAVCLPKLVPKTSLTIPWHIGWFENDEIMRFIHLKSKSASWFEMGKIMQHKNVGLRVYISRLYMLIQGDRKTNNISGRASKQIYANIIPRIKMWSIHNVYFYYTVIGIYFIILLYVKQRIQSNM